MKFLKILIKDFLSLGDVELTFEEGTRLLLGKNLDSLAADDNGAGKSSIGEAVRWCLYGETVRSAIDKTLDVLHVIREGTKKAQVSLFVEIDGHYYTIYRSRMKSKFEFTVTTEDGTTYKKAAADEMIADLIPLNVVQFANIVHLDGSYPQLFAPSTDKDRKDILADLVDISIVNQMQAEATNRLSPILDRARSLESGISIKEADIENAQRRIEDIREKARGHVREVRTLDSNLLAALGEQTELEDEEMRLQHELKQADDAVVSGLDKLKTEYNDLVDLIKEKTKTLEGIEDTYLLSELEEMDQKIHSRTTQRDICDSKSTEMQKLQSLGKCPTCGQDTASSKDISADIRALTSQTERHQSEIAKLSATRQGIVERRQAEIERTRSARNKLETRRDELDREIQVLVAKSERKEISQKLAKVRADQKDTEKRVSSLKADIKSKRALIKQAKEQWEDEEAWIKDKQIRLATAQTELIDLNRAIDRLDFWRKGFGPKGVPSLFIETVLPQISERIQKYADILTGGDVIVNLKAYRETKSKTVQESIQISAVNTKGASVYGANSTGERNRIDLAVTLGLIDYFKDVGVFESNLLVCDEIFDGLDATGVEQALIALNEAKIPSVLVVSHHEHLKPLFPETLYVQKQHGVAALVM